jgi:F-type H+-transporting ATPase subunit b
MYLVQPQLGLFFWTLVIFLILFILLRSIAWKPILQGLKAREESILASLAAAEAARQEMQKLTAKNEELLRQAQLERDKILKEATDARDRILSEARIQATQETQRLLKNARHEIEQEKLAALVHIKDQAAELSLQIAEKILRTELQNNTRQQEYVRQLLNEIQLN